jgi:hypothetical protein
MSDRLTELRRQRALLQQHADWLDREIAACLPATPAAPAAVPPPASPVVRPEPPAVADELYTPDPVSAGAQARRGCLVTVAVAALLLLALGAAIYFVYYRDRPLLMMEREDQSHDESPNR